MDNLMIPNQGMHASKMNGGLGKFGFMAKPRKTMGGINPPKIAKTPQPGTTVIDTAPGLF